MDTDTLRVRRLANEALYDLVAQARSIDGPVTLRDARGGAPFDVAGAVFAAEYTPACVACGADGHHARDCKGEPVCVPCRRAKIRWPGVPGWVCTTCPRPAPTPSDLDAVVVRLVPAWCADIMASTAGDVCKVVRDPDGSLALILRVAHDGRRQQFTCRVAPGAPIVRGGVLTWGMARLGPGTWDVAPSLHVPGVIHAFVTLTGVPEPPPWETDDAR